MKDGKVAQFVEKIDISKQNRGPLETCDPFAACFPNTNVSTNLCEKKTHLNSNHLNSCTSIYTYRYFIVSA